MVLSHFTLKWNAPPRITVSLLSLANESSRNSIEKWSMELLSCGYHCGMRSNAQKVWPQELAVWSPSGSVQPGLSSAYSRPQARNVIFLLVHRDFYWATREALEALLPATVIFKDIVLMCLKPTEREELVVFPWEVFMGKVRKGCVSSIHIPLASIQSHDYHTQPQGSLGNVVLCLSRKTRNLVRYRLAVSTIDILPVWL